MAADGDKQQVPTSYGLLLFPQFEVLDAAGPIQMLNVLSFYLNHQEIQLSVIAPTMDAVTPAPVLPDKTSQQFNGQQMYLPTHSFETAPPLDVLIVPEGWGVNRPDEEIAPIEDFIRKVYRGYDGRVPAQYLFSICGGAKLLARAGVLDGHKATTNKRDWARITRHSQKTHWIARARWVESGNIRTTSGVTAGMDGMVALIAKIYGDGTAEQVCDIVSILVKRMRITIRSRRRMAARMWYP